MIRKLLLHIGTPIAFLIITGSAIFLQQDTHVVPSEAEVVVPASGSRITADGKNILGLPDDAAESRVIAALLEEEPIPKVVALTFDDGPHPWNTPDLLEILDRYDIHATFFLHGLQVEKFPEIAKEVAEHGHAIGNHSYNHYKAQFANPDLLRSNVETTTKLIRQATGVMPIAFRPPGGRALTDMSDIVGMPIVLWSVDTRDWQIRNVDEIVRKATEKVVPGDIILMHDIYATSVESVPAIIETLRAQGFGFVTVGELLDLPVPTKP